MDQGRRVISLRRGVLARIAAAGMANEWILGAVSALAETQWPKEGSEFRLVIDAAHLELVADDLPAAVPEEQRPES
ncbi:MAG: hypothetical protein ACYDAY_12050 [Candidatus Dormibacteria bacterium]